MNLWRCVKFKKRKKRTTLTNQSYFKEEIKKRLQSGGPWFHSRRMILLSLQHNTLKIEMQYYMLLSDSCMVIKLCLCPEGKNMNLVCFQQSAEENVQT
jgi:hypothetical protein